MDRLDLLLTIVVTMTVSGCNVPLQKVVLQEEEGTSVTFVPEVKCENYYRVPEKMLPYTNYSYNKTILKNIDYKNYELRNEYLGKKYSLFEGSCIHNLIVKNVIELITPCFFMILGNMVELPNSLRSFNTSKLKECRVLRK